MDLIHNFFGGVGSKFLNGALLIATVSFLMIGYFLCVKATTSGITGRR